MKSHEPRSSSSCAACKLLKRRCSPNCIFAPYFRSDEPKKFAKVHKVFGASNVSKILVEVPEEQREDTVNSLAYEAEARLIDPVYGCIGAIALLQRKMIELQHDLALARARLARYAAPDSAAIGSTESDRFSMGPLGELPVAAYGGFMDSFSQTSFEVNQDAHMFRSNRLGQSGSDNAECNLDPGPRKAQFQYEFSLLQILDGLDIKLLALISPF